MIEYYYKSKSDVLFKRVSLEHERKTNINKQQIKNEFNSNIHFNSNYNNYCCNK